MRTTTLLLATMLLAGLGTLPTAAATDCAYYQTTHTTVPFSGLHLTEQRYDCTTLSGSKLIEQRVDIYRFADGEPGSPDATVHAHIEYQSLRVRDFATNTETRENFVMLKDGTGRVPYTEAEYKDQRTGAGACQGRATVYRGSQTSTLVTAAVPGCLPVRELLP